MEELVTVKIIELSEGVFGIANDDDDEEESQQIPSCLSEHDYLETRLDPRKSKKVQAVPRSVIADLLEAWRGEATQSSNSGFESQEDNVEAIDKIRVLLPSNYHYYFQKWDYQSDLQYSCVFRVKEVKNKEMAEQWMKKYREMGSTTWRLRKTYPGTGLRNLFKIDLKCQHNTDKRTGKTPHKTRVSKNTNCPAKLQLIIRRYIKHSRAKKPDNLVAEWPCIVYLEHVHNHDLNNAPAAATLRDGPMVYKIFPVNLLESGSTESDPTSTPSEELEISSTNRSNGIVVANPALRSTAAGAQKGQLVVQKCVQDGSGAETLWIGPSSVEPPSDSDDDDDEEEEVCCPCRRKCRCHCHSSTNLIMSHELHDYAAVTSDGPRTGAAVRAGVSVKQEPEEEVEVDWNNGNEDMAEFMYYFGIKAKQNDVT